MPQYKDQYDHIGKFGRNTDVDTGVGLPEDIWDAGAAYAWPSAAATTTIVSSSTDDDGAPVGTGAHTVQVYGLDANYLKIDETVTLNGTSAVTLSNQYLRVFRAKVLTAGSGEVNAGNIQIKHGSTVLAQITTDYGQTLMAIYTVPADYTEAWLVKWYVSLTKKQTAAATVVIQMRAYGGAWQTKEVIGVSSTSGDSQYEYPQWLAVAPKTDIRLRVIYISADNTDVSGRFVLLMLYVEPSQRCKNKE